MRRHDDGEHWGWFEAPATPSADTSLRITPGWSPARLSRAIIAFSWRWVLSGALLLMVFNGASMLLPVVIGQVVDRIVAPVTEGTRIGDLGWPILAGLGALVGLYTLMNLTYRFGGRLGWFGVQRAQYALAQAVVGRVLDERGMAGPAHRPGALLSVATADVHRSCLVLYVTVYPPGEIVGVLVAAGILLWIHPLLGVGVIAALPVVLFATHQVARPLRRRSMHEQAGLADAAAQAGDLVAGYRVIRGLHAHATAAERYRVVSRRTLQSTLSARSAKAGFDGVSTFTGQAFAACVATGAAFLAFDGHITAGQLVTAAGIAVTLVGPIDSLIGALGSFWAISQGSAERLLALIDTPHRPEALGTADPAESDDGVAELALDGVRLPGCDTSLDLTVRAGDFVVLDLPQAAHGPFADALSSCGGPAEGAIRLRGDLLTTLRPVAVREILLVCPHAAGLWPGTVLENVQAAAPQTVTAERAVAALEATHLSDGELPAGFATEAGDAGNRLSGGQRQRIALARALAADPDVLVLIEPTTSVDAVTEQAIADRLVRARAGRTTLVVTASPAFARVADETITYPTAGRDVRHRFPGVFGAERHAQGRGWRRR